MQTVIDDRHLGNRAKKILQWIVIPREDSRYLVLPLPDGQVAQGIDVFLGLVWIACGLASHSRQTG